MFFTAQPVPAVRAAALGIINHVVAAEEIEAFTTKMARQICANSPISLRVIKEELRILTNALPMTPETFERLQELRRMAYNSEDYQEGRAAFLEKRPPVFKGE
jgi:methylmalonyl-CoA decarboxylase